MEDCTSLFSIFRQRQSRLATSNSTKKLSFTNRSLSSFTLKRSMNKKGLQFYNCNLAKQFGNEYQLRGDLGNCQRSPGNFGCEEEEKIQGSLSKKLTNLQLDRQFLRFQFSLFVPSLLFI
ncbi:hypothetical protein T11_13068 [Trichinella zimbabwensis]|uniref:Uncharacterized protein n=1 Tax=Trichinella zimbabwensis TaxID=268475 RepID=A0A0V1HY44_9BILA|nr:hypothetical protein T11_13068 [Trichinella zimbabwensis]